MAYKINFNKKGWHYAEKIFFLLAALASLWPILSTPVFAMLDAPAHLYNTKLLYELLIKHNETVKQYYEFNHLIVPNWTGHILMLFLMLFFNAVWTQKIFIIIYLVIFPYSFRYLISSNKGNITLSYFAFPLSYSYFFFLGFFNFLIGLPITLFGMAYWMRNSSAGKLKNYLILALFSLLIFFSHPILYAVWCAFIALFFLYESAYCLYDKKSFKELFKSTVCVVVAILPSLILAMLYLINQPKDELTIKLKSLELLTWIINIRSLLVFSMDINELKYTYFLLYSLIGILISGLTYSVYRFIKKQDKSILQVITKLFWFDLSILILILYFILPDESNGGGYISSRLNLLFFIFLVLGFSQLKQFKLINILFVIAVLFAFNTQLFYFNSIMKPLNKNAEAVIKLSDYIEEGKTLISIDKSQNWMQGHLCNYVGANKLIFTQENYEASKRYFPLVWNMKARPELYFGEVKSDNTCVYLMPVENKNKIEADYVMLISNYPINQECDSLINSSLNNYYKLLYKSDNEFVKLFFKKI